MSTKDHVYWLERVTKWRTLFAGWQLGTRMKGDPESDAVRDQRELTILLRVEQSALAALLIRKGVFTEQEFADQVGVEAQALDASYERRFPGIRSSEEGLVLTPEAIETMRGWKP